MDLGLKGKIALVCGGGRGIAYAAAEEFAREGCTVVICARDAEALTAATAKLEALGVPVLAIEADLATEAGITKVVDTTKARFGRVDILICNTGGPQTGPAMGQDWAAWQKATELLLRSVVELTRAFVPHAGTWMGTGRGNHVTGRETSAGVAGAEQQFACRRNRLSAHTGRRSGQGWRDGEFGVTRLHGHRTSRLARRCHVVTHRAKP